MGRLIDFYNAETSRFSQTYSGLDKKTREAVLNDFIDTNPQLISWTVNLKQELLKERKFEFVDEHITKSLYRPFTKQWMYFSKAFNERVLQMPHIFPEAGVENIVIQFDATYDGNGYPVIISNVLPDLSLQW